MRKEIDYISFNKTFWIQWKEHLVSFGFEGLPECTHFTIVFDKRYADLNFHVTRNVTDEKDKPQIKIVIINKKTIEKHLNLLATNILNYILEPLDIQELKSKYNHDLGFIALDHTMNSDTSIATEEQFIKMFKIISKVKRKTRLKVRGDIEKQLEDFIIAEPLHKSFLEKLVDLPDHLESSVHYGLILSEDNIHYIIRINDRWYTRRKDIEPHKVWRELISSNLARKIIWKTKRALVALKYANCYSDTMHLDKPIRLAFKKEYSFSSKALFL